MTILCQLLGLQKGNIILLALLFLKTSVKYITMLENINAQDFKNYYRVLARVIKPNRSFLLFRKLYGLNSLRRLHNYLNKKGYKVVYYSCEFKDGSKINIAAKDLD